MRLLNCWNDEEFLTDSETPDEIFGTVEALDEYLNLPAKSKEKYVQAYESFIEWKTRGNKQSFTEDVFVAYFEDLTKKYKPSSLWPIYSMLRATLKSRHGVDLKNYYTLRNFLKLNSTYLKAKKPSRLSAEQVEKFLNEAPDIEYLVTKVALIFGIAGACNIRELAYMNTEDIEDRGEMYLVSVTNTGTKSRRTFTIQGQFYGIVKKYEALRKQDVKHGRFFQNYQKGKCTAQPIGINKMCKMPKDIARYLGLPDIGSYSGQTFKRTSSTLIVDSATNIEDN